MLAVILSVSLPRCHWRVLTALVIVEKKARVCHF